MAAPEGAAKLGRKRPGRGQATCRRSKQCRTATICFAAYAKASVILAQVGLEFYKKYDGNCHTAPRLDQTFCVATMAQQYCRNRALTMLIGSNKPSWNRHQGVTSNGQAGRVASQSESHMRNCLDVPSMAIGPARAPRPVPHRNRHYRTIFISETHLGTPGCKAELLADFLTHNECRTLYLVGDIIDGWALKQGWFWSPEHSRVVDLILRKVDEGTRVVYVPGNHDEAFRKYCGLVFAGVELKREAIHETAGGQALLVIHGDHSDTIVTFARWLALLGDRAYTLALILNDVFNHARRRLGRPYCWF